MKTYLTIALTVLALQPLTQLIHAQLKPNIVVIMADDVGLGDLSHHVRTFQRKEPVVNTPNIDALARESLWFTDGHSATSLCSPTRYCVMSGNNNYRSNAPWGVWSTFRETAFKPGEATLGSVVKQAGYRTGFVGKWHLGGDFRDKKTGGIYRGKKGGNILSEVDVSKLLGGGPKYCGFDYDFTLPCGVQGPVYTVYENESWYPLSEDSKIIYLDKDSAPNPKDVTSKGPGPGDSAWDSRKVGDLISQKAADFIASAPADQPFFLYYCSPAVHVPHTPPETFDGQNVSGTTPSPHLDMIVELDLQVKRIVDALKAKGVFQRTLLVFTSDNGGLSGSKETQASGHRSSGGWAKSKNAPEEGGHRVPFFARWKGHILPGITDELAVNQDMLATFAALVGTEIPNDQAQDSNNLLPLLTSSGTFHPRDYLAQQAGSQHELMYRKGPWKLIIQSNHLLTKFDPIALYNLEDNPQEKPDQNRVAHPEYAPVAKKMLKEYLEIYTSRQRTVPLSE